jgi:hypothetical protein
VVKKVDTEDLKFSAKSILVQFQSRVEEIDPIKYGGKKIKTDKGR